MLRAALFPAAKTNAPRMTRGALKTEPVRLRDVWSGGLRLRPEQPRL